MQRPLCRRLLGRLSKLSTSVDDLVTFVDSETVSHEHLGLETAVVFKPERLVEVYDGLGERMLHFV